MDDFAKQARSCLYTVKLGTIEEMVLPGLTPTGGASSGDGLKPGMLVDGKYSVLGLIGKGGMGAVYRVHHRSLDKDMALKTITAAELSDGAMRRFQDEARAIARLENKYVVKVFDFGKVENGRPYYTMELLSGESLADLIDKQGRLMPARAVAIFIDVCRGLAAAHAKGLVHGDIKPANIFLHSEAAAASGGASAGVAANTTAKIVDFGIVSIVQAGADELQEQSMGVFGSPLYMSPEQFRGERLGFGSDIYSCGCALYEALTGAPPFMGATVFATMNLHLTASPPDLAAKISTDGAEPLPRRLCELVAKMLAKDPAQRPQSFAEVEQDLQTIFKVLSERSGVAPVIVAIKGDDHRSDSSIVAVPGAAQVARGGKFIVGPLFGASAVILIVLIVGSFAFLSGHRKTLSNSIEGRQIGVSTAAAISSEIGIAGADEKKALDRAFIGNESEPRPAPSFYSRAVASGSFDVSTPGDLAARPPRRSFRFPPGLSLGRFEYKLDGKKFERPAEGAMTLPFDSLLRLGATVGRNPQILNGFGANSLYNLSVEHGVEFDDRHMKYVSGMAQIAGLSLCGAKLSDDFINYLNRLERLSLLGYDGCSQPASNLLLCKRLKDLTFLNVTRSEDVSKLLREFPVGSRLLQLNASFDHLGDADMESIAQISSLQVISLKGNNAITTRGLAKLRALPKLKYLEVERVKIEPSIIDDLKAFKSLNQLRISTELWSDAQLARFKKELPQIELISISN